MFGERVELARLARGMSQRHLAGEIGVSAAAISKIERNEMSATAETAASIARSTKFPPDFFRRPIEPLPPPLYRKRTSASKKLMRRTEAMASVYVEAQTNILRSAGVCVPCTIPHWSGVDPEKAAGMTREHLGLEPAAPILHMAATLENAGVVLIQLRTLLERFDGFSTWSASGPVVILNRGHEGAGDRERFTMAHELGHLVMHRESPIDLAEAEHQADVFASAFLLPREGVLQDLRLSALTPVAMLRLKEKWRTSAQALFMRAVGLGLANKGAKERFFKEISARGWRKNEPVAIPLERPQVLRKAIGYLRINKRHSSSWNTVRFSELATLIGLEAIGDNQDWSPQV